MATIPIFLPGESHGQRSLAGQSPWGHKELDTTEATQHAHMHCSLPIRREKCWEGKNDRKEFVHQKVRKCISPIPGYWKRLMLGKIEGKRRRGGQDEMVGWRHQLGGLEFEQARGVDDGQGGLVCCSPWGRRVRHD